MKQFVDTLEKTLTFVGVLMLSVFIILVIYQIFGRFFNLSVAFTEEISNYAFIWSIFIGGAVMLRKNEHFSFSAFLDIFPKKMKEIVQMINTMLLLVFSAIVFYYGLRLTAQFWSWSFSSIPSLKLGYAWLCVPISGASAIIFSIERLLQLGKEFRLDKGVK